MPRESARFQWQPGYAGTHDPNPPITIETAVGGDLNLSAASGAATGAGGTVALGVTVVASAGAASTGGTATFGPAVLATAGAATGAGGTSMISVTLLASSGAATGAGGTVLVADGVTASSGAATGAGGTASLAVTLSASAGAATGAGGTATVSAGDYFTDLFAGSSLDAAWTDPGPASTVSGGLLTTGFDGELSRSLLALKGHDLIADLRSYTDVLFFGFYDATDNNPGVWLKLVQGELWLDGANDSSSGTAISGPVTLLSFPDWLDQGWVKLGIDSAGTTVRAAYSDDGTTWTTVGTWTVADDWGSTDPRVQIAAYGGDTAVLGGFAVVGYGDATPSSMLGFVVDRALYAIYGDATGAGGTAALAFTLSATAGAASAGGSASIATGLTAASGAATGAGGTVSLAATLTASGGAASTGGTVTLAETVTATSGSATGAGGTASLAVTLLASGGAATGAGGDATATVVGGNLNLTVTGGMAYGQAGAVLFSLGLSAASGAASGAGGTVTYTYGGLSAASGLATGTTGGMLLRLIYVAASGAATGAGSIAGLTLRYDGAYGTATGGGGSITLSGTTGPKERQVVWVFRNGRMQRTGRIEEVPS